MAAPQISRGWLEVPFDGDEMATIEIAVGRPENRWPAYLDWDGPQRVAKIRVPTVQSGPDGVTVWLIVAGHATQVGGVRLR